MRKTLFCFLLSVTLLALGGATAIVKADDFIVFARPYGMMATHAFVADHEGYFRDEHLNIQFEKTINAKIAADALVAGRAVATVLTDSSLVYFSFSGDDSLRILAQGGSHPEMTVVARRDSGIASPSDLRGKRVGYLPGTASYMFLVRLLDRTGLTLRDVTPVALQPPAMPQALQGGALDAFVMWEPWVDQAVKALGENAVTFRASDVYAYKIVFVVRQDFAVRKPEQVRALLRAFLKAEAFIKAHPEETLRLMSKVLKLDEAILRKNWKDYDFTIKLDDDALSTMREDARYVIRDDPNFAGKAIPDFRRYIDPTFLREVAPERVKWP